MYQWYIKKKIKSNIEDNKIYNALEMVEQLVAKQRRLNDMKSSMNNTIINSFKSLEIDQYVYNDVVLDKSSETDNKNESDSTQEDKSQWMIVVEDYIQNDVWERMENIKKFLRNTLSDRSINEKDILEYFIYSCPGDKLNFDEYDSRSVSATTVNSQEFLGNTNRFSPINSNSKYVTYDTYCNFVLGLLSVLYVKQNIVEINVYQNGSKHKAVELQKRIYFIQYYLMGLFDRTEYLKKCYEYERECLVDDTKGEVFNLSQAQKNARIKEIDEELLNIEFSKGNLTYKEYLKNYYTIHEQKWVNFTLSPDADHDNPDMVEIDVEYNEYFIEWLKSKDLEYDPHKFESYQDLDPNSDDYKEMFIEGWVKNTLMRTAASLLAEYQEDDQYGDTFQSVLASSPEGSIVENIEIDKDSYNNEDEFNNVLKYVKNRRMYK